MISNYIKYRRLGLRNAWQIANMPLLVEKLAWYIAVAVISMSVYAAYENTLLIRLDQQAVELHDRYVNLSLENKALKKIVASCVGPREGSIWIGDTLYLCGVANTGIKK